ncbi:MAG: hypothetical protein P8O22_05600 [Akkermansiaceae bacterium]|nr:hypothetical protein [Akkermansiaceae bacterium]
MISTIKTSLLLSFATVFLITGISENAYSQNQKKKQSVRMMRNDDGSFTEFRRSSNERILEKRILAPQEGGNGELATTVSFIYRKDIHGRLRSCKIHDAIGTILYRVSYGYHKDTGRLDREYMFDAQVKRTYTIIGADGKPTNVEKPVRRLYYRYDAQGRPAKPIAICLPPGKRAEELFGKNKGTWTKDPFNKK